MTRGSTSADPQRHEAARRDLVAKARRAQARDRRISEAFTRRGREPWPGFNVIRGGLTASGAEVDQ